MRAWYLLRGIRSLDADVEKLVQKAPRLSRIALVMPTGGDSPTQSAPRWAHELAADPPVGLPFEYAQLEDLAS